MANNPQGSGRLVTQQIQQVRTGPIPDHNELAGYEAITPGFANRILVMAESEASSRQKLNADALAAGIADGKSERTEKRIGQVCAFILAIIGMTLGYLAATNGHETFGSIVGGSSLVLLCLAFLTGKLPTKLP
ncbi:MAG: DUF2335 domain-containing protein [Planctomycetes bacterium]|nr:DUF2335 domain-containing protein [Planctomycetota bacterium]